MTRLPERSKCTRSTSPAWVSTSLTGIPSSKSQIRIAPLWVAITPSIPSGGRSKPMMGCFTMTSFNCLFLPQSQIPRVPSRDAVRSLSPRIVNLTWVTRFLCLLNVWIGSNSGSDHNFTLPSSPALTANVPDGWKTRLLISPKWASSRVVTNSWVFIFHKIRVPSRLPESRKSPLVSIERDVTSSRCPRKTP